MAPGKDCHRGNRSGVFRGTCRWEAMGRDVQGSCKPHAYCKHMFPQLCITGILLPCFVSICYMGGFRISHIRRIAIWCLFLRREEQKLEYAPPAQPPNPEHLTVTPDRSEGSDKVSFKILRPLQLWVRSVVAVVLIVVIILTSSVVVLVVLVVVA